jgi:hypothetical protein
MTDRGGYIATFDSLGDLAFAGRIDVFGAHAKTAARVNTDNDTVDCSP